VFLLALCVVLALVFQYAIAPVLAPEANTRVTHVPYVGKYLMSAWNESCEVYEDDLLKEKCRGNSGVYRVTGCTTLFFFVAAIGARFKSTFNREAWPAKYTLFLVMVAASIFVSNNPWFDSIYMPVARVGSVFFIVMQQIILIDLAYKWNERWVDNSNYADTIEYGSGKKWLMAILVCCAALYVGSLVGIGMLFHHFKGCATNEFFVSLTLILIVIMTVLQLCDKHGNGSLLTSAVMSMYAAYLAYSAVSTNPNGECNPRLDEHDTLGIAVGMGLTFLSLAWTGWSFSSVVCVEGADGIEMNSDVEDSANPLDSPLLRYDNSPAVRGVVSDADGPNADDSGDTSVGRKMVILNIVLACVSCWVAMSLTGWGSVQSGGDVANPRNSVVNMWMIIVSQWVALGLYCWTIMAPILFPDRDFS